MNEVDLGLDFFGVSWRLGATLFFVILNGFFVAAEFSLVKVRASRIRELAAEGRAGAKSTQRMLAQLDRYLSGCQLGITMASLVLGALGEPAVSRVILAALDALGYQPEVAPPWVPVLSIGLAFVIITALHMTLGEQAPKMWALRHAEGTVLRAALPLRAFTVAFWPFIDAINSLSNWMLRAVGVPPGAGYEPGHSGEEIRSILSLSARAGHISDRQQELAENVFRLIELEVRHIVAPRVDIEFLSLTRTPEKNLEILRSSTHSRFPLCEDGLDTIIGFVHGKDVLEQVLDGRPVDLRAVARDPLFVPDTMPLSDFLLEIQSRLVHAAAVVDERGTVVGLAFREDALEEIVGPLGDEFDQMEFEFRETAPGCYELSGHVPLPEVEDRLDFELLDEEDEGQDTIGGHVIARLHRFARKGDEVDVGPYRAKVIEVSRRRVQRVRMQRRREDETAEEERKPEPAPPEAPE